MIARGKREARRPWFCDNYYLTRPERPKYPGITPFQGYTGCLFVTQGRRASRLPLAIISRAVGAPAYRAPLALRHIARRWRSGISRAVGAPVQLFVQSGDGNDENLGHSRVQFGLILMSQQFPPR